MPVIWFLAAIVFLGPLGILLWCLWYYGPYKRQQAAEKVQRHEVQILANSGK